MVGEPMDEKGERDLRAAVYGWRALTFEMCRQRLMDPSLNVDFIADLCAHTLMDGVGRVPGIPAVLADAVAAPQR
ncbi:TetR family transcriptional regulator [Mycobacterium sp. Soil538]|nr:TetR family transcriptional regulator [Mycobacterium sp. Soil538]